MSKIEYPINDIESTLQWGVLLNEMDEIPTNGGETRPPTALQYENPVNIDAVNIDAVNIRADTWNALVYNLVYYWRFWVIYFTIAVFITAVITVAVYTFAIHTSPNVNSNLLSSFIIFPTLTLLLFIIISRWFEANRPRNVEVLSR